MEFAIDVRDLRRSYGSLEAVRGVSFSVVPGEVFCLLGPNGAGKTTTTEILEGYRRRTSGDGSVLGFDPAAGGRAFRERVGIVLQETGVQAELSVGEVLRMYARYYPRPRQPRELIELVALDAKEDTRIKRLSGGQRRRLDLALALVGDPDLVFLDEPTTGFDPSARRAAWDAIRALCDLGKTVVLTTHFMEEAQALADRVAVMRDGEIVATGAPDELGGPRHRAHRDPLRAARGHDARRPAAAGRRDRRPARAGPRPRDRRPRPRRRPRAHRLGARARPRAAQLQRRAARPRRRLPHPHGMTLTAWQVLYEHLRAARGGGSIAELAGALYLSPGTVRNYLSAAMQKLGARSRAEAVRLADERGWL
jgi:ABC-2 type transport system ATP-binding protein